MNVVEGSCLVMGILYGRAILQCSIPMWLLFACPAGPMAVPYSQLPLLAATYVAMVSPAH